jgi:hypothetical protein
MQAVTQQNSSNGRYLVRSEIYAKYKNVTYWRPLLPTELEDHVILYVHTLLVHLKTRISILIKIQLDATVCSLIYFTAKSLYTFRVSTASIIRSTKNCNRSLRYMSLHRYSHFPPTWPGRDVGGK